MPKDCVGQLYSGFLQPAPLERAVCKTHKRNAIHLCPAGIDSRVGRPQRAKRMAKRQNYAFSSRFLPQDAISLFGALWGWQAENA
jgi:hypothetical protein